MVKRINYYHTIRNWIIKSKLIHKRKFYSSCELRSLFEKEMHVVDSITQLTLKKTLNKIAESQNDAFFKDTKGRGKDRYIILNNADSPSFLNNIRISQRNRGISVPSPIIMSCKNKVQADTPNTPTPAVTNEINVSSDTTVASTKEVDHDDSEKVKEVATESLNSSLNSLKGISKIDSPVALSFFFGKERAEKIEKEEKEEAQNEPIIKYGKIVREQIRAQIQKLQEAHLTFDGWRLLLDDYDITNCMSQREIYSLRIKACYLSKFYATCLKYYTRGATHT